MARAGIAPVIPYDFSPACWTWEPPPVSLRDQASASLTAIPLGCDLIDRLLPVTVMRLWQRGRCATCGHHARLIIDHDHATGLIRGYLCSGCNTAEGMNRYAGRVWREYRERNPATICGVREQYWNPVLKEYAEPLAPLADKWRNNPMKGIGL